MAMTLEELRIENKISKFEYLLYKVFEMDSDGRELIGEMFKEEFMNTMAPNKMTAEWLAFNEGRRSIIRMIVTNSEIIEALMENNNE